jgi:Delta7-sterol 5-desaturase
LAYNVWFMRTPTGWVLASVTHHALHHERFSANDSLYFNVWDRLFGTNHPDYHARFEETSGAGRMLTPRGCCPVGLRGPPS